MLVRNLNKYRKVGSKVTIKGVRGLVVAPNLIMTYSPIAKNITWDMANEVVQKFMSKHSHWRMPTKEDFTKINKTLLAELDTIEHEWMWTSTVHDKKDAWDYDINNGQLYHDSVYVYSHTTARAVYELPENL